MNLRTLLTGFFGLLIGFLTAQQFAESSIATPCTTCDEPLVCANGNPDNPATGVKLRIDYAGLPANDYDGDGYHDQWFDLYVPYQQAPESGYPVVVFAHAVGQDPTSVCGLGRALNSQGIVLISWASVDESTTFEDGTAIPQLILDRGVEDFKSMMQRVAFMSTQPGVPEIDWDKLFVTGVSRGARLSWKYLDELTRPGSDEPMVAGVILAQAFPDPEWYLSSETGYESALDLVNEDYPPVLLFYKDGPGVIGDIHEPSHGLEVARALDCFGVNRKVFFNVGEALEESDWLYYQLLQFMQSEHDEFFEGPSTLDLGNGTALPNIDTPGWLQVISNPYLDSEKRFAWVQEDWNLLEDAESAICTLRVSESNGAGYYQDCVFEEIALEPFDVPELGGVYPRYFFSPWEGFLDICDWDSIEDEVEYAAQVRCLLINEGEEAPRKFTPWSHVKEFTSPSCSELRGDIDVDILLDGILVTSGRPIQILQVFTADGLRIHEQQLDGRQSAELESLTDGLYSVRLLYENGDTAQTSIQITN